MQPMSDIDSSKRNVEKIDETARLKFKRQLRLQLEMSGIARKALVDELGSDEVRLCRWLNDNYPDNFPAALLQVWTREAGSGLLRWISAQCGYEIVPIGPVTSRHDAQALIALFSRHSGQALAQTIENIGSDCVWTEDEKRTDLRTWKRIQSFTNSIVEALEREVGQ